MSTLLRVSPEEAGIAPDAVLAFIDAVEERVGGLHSLMLLRHGSVGAEGWWAPYAPQLPHALYSLSKSFTSTAVGLAVAEGRLSVEERVVSFFPDEAPPQVSENLAAMRVKDLLTMSTGHDQDPTGAIRTSPDGDWVRAFLSVPVEHAPGSKFVYNSLATYMLSAIVQKLSGTRLVDYLQPRLFDPLGIEAPLWDACPRGINTGGWGLRLRTEEIARFGQCYLRKGVWDGRQVVPAAWVEEATCKQVSNGDGGASDWAQGYGYQFWRCRHNAYRGDGAFGQYCLVMPDQDAVLAITSGIGNMQAVLDAVWECLLPGMAPSAAGESAALRDRLARLEVSAPEGSPTGGAAGRVSGRTYRLDANPRKLESVLFAFSPDGCRMTLRGAEGEQTISSGSERWVAGVLPPAAGAPALGGAPSGRIAARGAWPADDTYTVKVCYVEAPQIETITCRFTGEEVFLSRSINVAFGPTEPQLFVGRAV